MQGNWKNAQRRILEEWDHHQDTGMFTRDDKFMGITMVGWEGNLFLETMTKTYRIEIDTRFS